MIPNNWPFCLCGKRVRNIVNGLSGTVIDIVSDRGTQRVRVALDEFGSHIDYRTPTFENRFTLLCEAPRTAEIISLDAYRPKWRGSVDPGTPYGGSAA